MRVNRAFALALLLLPACTPFPYPTAAYPARTSTPPAQQSATAIRSTLDSQETTPRSPFTSTPHLPAFPVTAITSRCLHTTGVLDPADLQSTVLVAGDFTDSWTHAPLFRLSATDSYPIPLELPEFAGSSDQSPQASALAYRHDPGVGRYQIIVANPRGEVINTYTLEKPFEGFTWLDEKTLALYHVQDSPVDVTLWEPSTNSTSSVALELPGLWAPDFWYGRWLISMSPDLSRVAFARGQDPATIPERTILWDVEQAESKWGWESWTSAVIEPAWHVSGDELAFAATVDEHHLEVFSVSESGRATKLVDAYHPNFRFTAIHALSWSPNGRYIAFVPTNNEPVLLLDIAQGVLINTCIRGDDSFAPLLWSPDGDKLIIPKEDSSGTVVDLEHSSAMPVFANDNLRPIAWLAAANHDE